MSRVKDLEILLAEDFDLTRPGRVLNKQEERRHISLVAAAAAVKDGASLKQIRKSELRETARQAGLPQPDFKPPRTEEGIASGFSRKKEARVRAWQHFIRSAPAVGQYKVEQRDMAEGVPLTSQIGTYSSLGFFVPTGFFPKLFSAMRAHDALFDASSGVTLWKTNNGLPTRFPNVLDVANFATVISEASTVAETDIANPGHQTLAAYTYRSPVLRVSVESFQDLEETLSVVKLFQQTAGERLAVGIAKDLMTGNGVGKTLGLISSLIGTGAAVVTAVGSSGNDGGSGTSANSLGTADFIATAKTLDAAYFPKARWLMNMQTFITVAGLLDKQGNLVNLIQYTDATPRILGIPIAICPSMDSIGASKYPVVLGDTSYWCTRLIKDELSGLIIYREAPGLIEKGEVGLCAFARADGALLYSGPGSGPFVLLQNHS